ncbi:MAG: response regulator [Methyloceanibacter sp.]|uniref:response regulator n=1 Tax=Methyloceanibacter sp. TaxID=1965321 RepID=UPI003D6D45DD
MEPKDFKPEDLFAQIQGLVDGLEAERTAREAAEVADKAKSDLIALIGRELRPPMEVVVAMAESLLSSPLDASQRRYTETLARSARSLLAALNDVLDFSSLEAGGLHLASQRLDLHALVRSVASVLQTRAGEKGLTSGVDMGANCPRFVLGDEVRLRQVLMSLVEAALRSTSEGSVRLYVSASETEDPVTIRFDVTDTGAGLSNAEQENLFRPTVQSTRAGGGLGMPIALRLAAAMGGEVGCDSKLGQGTLYWVTVPMERAQDQGETQVEQDGESVPKGALSGHLLVVEDNVVNRLLIGAYLDEFGVSYEMVETGAAAIMCVAARKYDLVLMDMVLPDFSGLETARRIRSLQAPSSEVPIVALAAHDATDSDNDYVAAGMNAHVSKPIRGRALYVALAPFLAGQGRAAHSKAS